MFLDATRATRDLRTTWRALDDRALAAIVREGRASVAAFTQVTERHGSLLQEWIAGKEVREYEHYPEGDVTDTPRGSQFYYHAHRDGDREHGHLHLFWHATASGRRRYFRPDGGRWVRTAPTHLVAVSLDARGLPVGLFTVNRWVTDGHWFAASTSLACLDRFAPAGVPGHEGSCRWLTSFVRLYRPVIRRLLVDRDRRVAARRGGLERVLDDRRLDVLSATAIDWAADLDALEAEAARRARRPRK